MNGLKIEDKRTTVDGAAYVLELCDQPVTCPWCGSRTEWTERADGLQEHLCYGLTFGNRHLFHAEDAE